MINQNYKTTSLATTQDSNCIIGLTFSPDILSHVILIYHFSFIYHSNVILFFVTSINSLFSLSKLFIICKILTLQ
jgi:hypothetical protein